VNNEHHKYPSNYGPGIHWSTDEAWKILDTLPPGVLSDEHRAYLAGLIAGTLTRVGANAQTDAERLRQAEAALTELTDQCSGSCNWGDPSTCSCRERFWPAIECIRALRREIIDGPR
jgi:hypothetical protein